MNTTESKYPKTFIILVRALIPIIIIALAVFGFQKMQTSRKKHSRKAAGERSVVVETVELVPTISDYKIHAVGSVVPARSLQLRSQVSGKIVRLSDAFQPGNIVRSGHTLVTIDDTDLKIALETQKASLIQAEYAYTLELGQQENAKHEWKMLGRKNSVSKLEKDLSLRVPHLKKAEADLNAAKARLQKAQIDIERTSVSAPFDAVIVDRLVEMGSVITTQTTIANLIGIDEFWIEAKVPFDTLKWIQFDENGQNGSEVIIWPTGNSAYTEPRIGKVLKLLPSLEKNGRMAQILISVKHPLMKEKFPLLVDSVVSIVIKGKQLENICMVPQSAVHDGNIVWLNNNGRMEMREVDVVWRDSEQIAISHGVNMGEQLIVTEITSPIDGLKLELFSKDNNNKINASQDKQKNKGGKQ